MPQIAVQQPTNLMEMFSSASPMMWDIARNQVQDQTLGNALNRAQAQQSMDFDKQKQPFELAQLGLANDTTRAQLPGVTANSSMLLDKATLSRNTLGKQQESSLSELAKKISDNDLSMAEAEIQRGLIHPDPSIRKQATQMWPLMSKIREERMKYEEQRKTSVATTNANIQGQKELEKMRIDAGKYLKAGTMNAKLRLDSLTKPSEIDAVLRQILSDENLPEQERAKYMARFVANTEALKTENAVRTASNAGKLNVPEMTGTPGIEAPTIAPAPQQAQPAASAPPLKSNYAPKTQEEYNRIPSGQIYLDTDGQYKRKK